MQTHYQNNITKLLQLTRTFQVFPSDAFCSGAVAPQRTDSDPPVHQRAEEAPVCSAATSTAPDTRREDSPAAGDAASFISWETERERTRELLIAGIPAERYQPAVCPWPGPAWVSPDKTTQPIVLKPLESKRLVSG